MPDVHLPTPLLTAHALCKSFGEVQVLHNIELSVNKGQVLALLGENGAGKSTLVKLLGGYEQPTSGTLQIAGVDNNQLHNVADWNHRNAESHGVVLIHQELNLAEQLSATENIFLGNELKRGLFLDMAQMQQLAQGYLHTLSCNIDPSQAINELPISAKQMIEIAKAYAKNSRVLILDEPTAVLTAKESEVLFQLIDKLKAEGVAIIYISHKLEEIERIADRVVILRDGELVGDYEAKSLTKDDMARLMVGRELTNFFPATPAPKADAEVLLEVINGQLPGVIFDASFALKAGEILGFAGLVGSGRTALMEAIVGLRAFSASSEVRLQGEKVSFPNLAAARSAGLAYLTKDRKECGLLLNMSLPINFSLFALQRFSNGLINSAKENQEFLEAVETFDIRVKDLTINAGNLSGGNQQKLLLAKLMAAQPRVIIIDEPTRGIDIGTKSQIYHFISELAKQGHAIIVVSSDMMEVMGVSHRVAVMCGGHLAGILEGDDIDEHEIMRYATGLKTQSVQGKKISA
jgi:ribose transport system ATP-binding protein